MKNWISSTLRLTCAYFLVGIIFVLFAGVALLMQVYPFLTWIPSFVAALAIAGWAYKRISREE